MIGARLCAEHQPQRVEIDAVFDQPGDVCFAKLLRLVFDTAALRKQVTTYAPSEIQPQDD